MRVTSHSSPSAVMAVEGVHTDGRRQRVLKDSEA